MEPRSAAHLLAQNLRQRYKPRKLTLMKKIHELCTMFGVTMYVVLANGDETIAINSAPQQNWLPADEQLESRFGFVERFDLVALGEAVRRAERNYNSDLPQLPELL